MVWSNSVWICAARVIWKVIAYKVKFNQSCNRDEEKDTCNNGGYCRMVRNDILDEVKKEQVGTKYLQREKSKYFN